MHHATVGNCVSWQRRDQRDGAHVRAQTHHGQREAGKKAVGDDLLGGAALANQGPDERVQQRFVTARASAWVLLKPCGLGEDIAVRFRGRYACGHPTVPYKAA